VSVDVKELISLEDVMEEMELGPNGGLVFCMEYLIDHFDWLHDELEQLGNDAYVIFDCPGQIELYSHVPVMRALVTELQRIDFAMAAVYLLDAQFMVDPSKYMSVSEGARACARARCERGGYARNECGGHARGERGAGAHAYDRAAARQCAG
jgi:GTPase SAR1 family protein